MKNFIKLCILNPEAILDISAYGNRDATDYEKEVFRKAAKYANG